MTPVKAGWADVPQYEEWALQSFEFYAKLMEHQGGRYKAEYGLTMAKLTSFFYKHMSLNADDKSKDHDESKLAHIEKNSTGAPPRMTGFQRHRNDLQSLLVTNGNRGNITRNP